MALGEEQAESVVTPLDHALDQLIVARDHLVKLLDDGGLDCVDLAGLAGFMRSFERFRNGQAVIDHRMITDATARGLPDAVTQPSMRQVLMHLLLLSPGEASRRVTAAEACGGRVTMTGEVLMPARPVLAAAQRDGEVSPEQVHIIAGALAKVDRPGFDPADITAGEQLLTEFAAVHGAKDLKQLADRVVDGIEPDGTLPNDQLNQDRRHFTIRPCRDGMYSGDFRLTGTLGAKLTALLQPLSRPRVETASACDQATAPPVDREGAGAQAVNGHAGNGSTVRDRVVDGRTFGQRTHDALEEICDRILQAGDVAGVGGTPATVIVTMSLDDLIQRLGYGRTSDGTLHSARDVLRLANQADIIPAVLDATGAVLTLGRTRRIASTAQTLALIARDHGCSFPGCDRAPEWCERHHITEWVDGGLTDLDNLTLLCRYHHHNFASRGWTCSINTDRLPEWTPPRWLDPQQRPLQNSRITAHLTAWRARRRPRRDAERPDPLNMSHDNPIPTMQPVG